MATFNDFQPEMRTQLDTLDIKKQCDNENKVNTGVCMIQNDFNAGQEMTTQ